MAARRAELIALVALAACLAAGRALALGRPRRVGGRRCSSCSRRDGAPCAPWASSATWDGPAPRRSRRRSRWPSGRPRSRRPTCSACTLDRGHRGRRRRDRASSWSPSATPVALARAPARSRSPAARSPSRRSHISPGGSRRPSSATRLFHVGLMRRLGRLRRCRSRTSRRSCTAPPNAGYALPVLHAAFEGVAQARRAPTRSIAFRVPAAAVRRACDRGRLRARPGARPGWRVGRRIWPLR